MSNKPSLDIILSVVENKIKEQYDEYKFHISKASNIMGVAGILIGVLISLYKYIPIKSMFCFVLGLLLFVVTAITCIGIFYPSKLVKGFKPSYLSENFMFCSPEKTKEHLLSAYLTSYQTNDIIIKEKNNMVIFSILTLIGGLILLILSVLIN